jgi:hypothetical protein
MKTVLEYDVVLCTLETLSKFKSTDPWGETSFPSTSAAAAAAVATESKVGNSDGSRETVVADAPWNRKKVVRSGVRNKHVAAGGRSIVQKGDNDDDDNDDEDDDDMKVELDDQVSCHCVLHRIVWGRLIVDDAHLIVKLPFTFHSWNHEKTVRSLQALSQPSHKRSSTNTATHNAKQRSSSSSSATSIAKSEALALLRAEKKWLLLSEDRTPKLWQDRTMLRRLTVTIGAPSDLSLVHIIPDVVLELG